MKMSTGWIKEYFGPNNIQRVGFLHRIQMGLNCFFWRVGPPGPAFPVLLSWANWSPLKAQFHLYVTSRSCKRKRKNHLHFIWGQLSAPGKSPNSHLFEFPKVQFTLEQKQNPHTHLKPTLWLLLMGDNFILLDITKLCTIRNSTL